MIKEILSFSKKLNIQGLLEIFGCCLGGLGLATEFKLIHLRYNSQSGLTQAQSGLTQAQSGLTQAQSGLTQAQSGLAQAQSGLTQAQSGLTQAQSGLKLAESYAPCLKQRNRHGAH